MNRSTTIGWQICKDDSTDSLAKQKVTCSSTASTSDPASFPDVSLAAKGVSAQGMKGKGCETSGRFCFQDDGMFNGG